MLTLSERIKKLMETTGSGPTDIARAAGIRSPSVHDWLNGRTKQLTAEPARRLAEYYGLSLYWLSHGSGPMHSGEAPNTAAPLADDEAEMLEIWRGLTGKQRAGFLEAMTAQKRDNDALMAELAGRRK